MRIIRFLIHGKRKFGILEKHVVHSMRGTPFARHKVSHNSFVFDGNTYDRDEIKLLSPCIPSKIVCLGLNYRTHAEETSLPLPAVPLIFLKPSTSVIGPEEEIVLPSGSGRVDYEGELGIVISRSTKHVPEESALKHVLGYTCFNDVSERHNQRDDGQWTRAKGYDTFAPLGPWIETGIAPDNLRLETYLNGEVRQSARTGDLIFSIPRVISFVSDIMTLLPGDVIATGTPSGIGRMKPGDTVEVRIEGIGTLRNTVISEQRQ